VALAEEEEAVDSLRLSGASRVLALKQQLAEYLANRVDTGRPEAHVVGEFHGLQLAELPARDTPFAGQAVRDTKLRQQTGLSVVGFWERGRLQPAFPQTVIHADSVIVVTGTADHVAALNAMLPRGEQPTPPVIVIGAGKVGQAAAKALKGKGCPVHAVDRRRTALAPLTHHVDKVFVGDAADRRVLERAGILTARSVLLTTNDDAMNVYLAVYCRRLNASLRIVSRITHERNLEAIHRAGADFVLSYTTLGIEAVMSLLRGHPPVLLGEGVELFALPVPASLAGRRLQESDIGSRTGLSVVALRRGDALTTPLTADTVLPKGADLVMLGSDTQRTAFTKAFGEV
jgi:voltage-gated potassium channel